MTISFGKYKGQLLQDVFKIDRSYVNWMLEQARLGCDDPKWGAKNKERFDQMNDEIKAIGEMSADTMMSSNSPAKQIEPVKTIKTPTHDGQQLMELFVLCRKMDEKLNSILKNQEAGGVAKVFGGEVVKTPEEILWSE